MTQIPLCALTARVRYVVGHQKDIDGGKYVQYDDDDDILDNDNDNENFDNVNDNNKKVKYDFPLGHICCLPSEIYRQAKLMITMKIVMMDNPVDSTMNSSDYQHVNMMDF